MAEAACVSRTVEPSEEEKQKIWDTGLAIEGEGGRVVFPGAENAPAAGN